MSFNPLNIVIIPVVRIEIENGETNHHLSHPGLFSSKPAASTNKELVPISSGTQPQVDQRKPLVPRADTANGQIAIVQLFEAKSTQAACFSFILLYTVYIYILRITPDVFQQNLPICKVQSINCTIVILEDIPAVFLSDLRPFLSRQPPSNCVGVEVVYWLQYFGKQHSWRWLGICCCQTSTQGKLVLVGAALPFVPADVRHRGDQSRGWAQQLCGMSKPGARIARI